MISQSAKKLKSLVGDLRGSNNQLVKNILAKPVAIDENTIQIGKNVMNINPDDGLRTTIRLWELMALVLKGKFIPYEKNRGDGAIKKNSIKLVRETFDPSMFGLISASYDSKNNSYCLADTHHRVIGLLHRLLDGNSTTDELNLELCMSIGKPDTHIEMYQGLNKCSKHGSREISSNTDFTVGREVARIVEALPPEQQEFFRKNQGCSFANALRNHIYVMVKLDGVSVDINDMTWLDVYSKSTASVKFSKNIVTDGEILTTSQVEKIVKGLDFYYKTFTHDNMNISETSVKKKLLKSHPLLGVIVQQAINPNQFSGQTHELPKSPGVFARALSRRASEIQMRLSNLVRGQSHSREDRFYDFPRFLKSK